MIVKNRHTEATETAFTFTADSTTPEIETDAYINGINIARALDTVAFFQGELSENRAIYVVGDDHYAIALSEETFNKYYEVL